MAIAIRTRGLGRYFGSSVEIDGAEQPREAWRALLAVVGISLRPAADDGVQRTRAVVGHVLRDVSLEVEQGSVVCLTGPSGSGKSVLLKILSGAIAPTAGSAEIYGRVTSVLSANGGLNELMSAAEAIEAAAKARDLSGDEAAAYAAAVIDFAELHGFEHVALRTYSTGMSMRLGMAMALCERPPILLIDDVLTVGDIGFQQKCLERLFDLKEAGSTILAAFSDDALVERLATRVVTLAGGSIASDSSPAAWALPRVEGHAVGLDWQLMRGLPEDDVFAVRSMSVEAGGTAGDTYMDVSLVLEARVAPARCRPNVFVKRQRAILFRSLYPEFLSIDAPQTFTCRVRVPTHMLPAGEYSLMISVVTHVGDLAYSLKADDVMAITIHREKPSAAEDEEQASPELFLLSFPWEIEALAEDGPAASA
jgi:ABC-type polysaccharide/polyol phosphate transport system ATPase subunit